jgi:glycosyltransferase involved in cell wall biosynthesis
MFVAVVPGARVGVELKFSVTVVVPVYRTEEFLGAALTSLVCQSHTDFGIVVVDDASPGNCADIVRSFQTTRHNIIYIRNQENRGPLYSRLTGIEQSSSDYVAFLDSDDTAKPHFLATLIEAAMETGADIIGSSVFRRRTPSFTIEGTENVVAALGSGKIPNHTVWSKLFRRTLFERSPELVEFARSNRIVHGEDAAIVATLVPKANVYHHVEDVLVNYTRSRSNSVTKNIDPEYLLQEIREVSAVASYIDRALHGYDDVRINFGQGRLGRYFRTKLQRVDDELRDTLLTALSRTPGGDQVLIAFAKAADRRERAATLQSARLRNDNQVLKERLAALKARGRELKTNNRELQSVRGIARKAARRLWKAAVRGSSSRQPKP